jgi:DNA-binding NarL/FixJ family response regulator
VIRNSTGALEKGRRSSEIEGMAMNPITIVLADDHTLLRRAVAAQLSKIPGFQVAADVGTTDDAITACIRSNPDVLVFDIDIPGVECFGAARTVRDRCPKTKILFLSAFTHDRYIDSALKVGALGYVTKNEPPEVVVKAIQTVAAGHSFFSAEVQARIVIDKDGASLVRNGALTRAATLTQRELEVLRYIARGMAKKEIAKVMHLSVKTVENHTANVMKRLDIHDRVDLARFAIREGLVEA